MAALVWLVGGEVGPGLLANVSTRDPHLLPHLPPHLPLPLGDLPVTNFLFLLLYDKTHPAPKRPSLYGLYWGKF